jgi:aromatic ring-opening dioxygenase catalytic subunit (LigB family)
MNERTNKIKCEGENGLSKWQKNKWMEICIKELRDEGWIDKWTNEWKIVLMKDEWKSKQMDEWTKEFAKKIEERISEWKERQMNDTWIE